MSNEITYDSDSGFTEEERTQIAEEVAMAFAISEGTMPMAREIGLSPDVLDRGMLIDDNALIAEVIDKLEAMDERISVTSVEIEHSANGEAKTKVVIERRDNA